MLPLFFYATTATARIIYETYKSIYFWYNIRNWYIILGILKNIYRWQLVYYTETKQPPRTEKIKNLENFYKTT